ncbi:MAG: apolipoprotein N-acyltransferase [Deltaproteobacteria bacterium]|nr:apolipoprotein N-acyltransferase [Deltaproteobacteria bacterium]
MERLLRRLADPDAPLRQVLDAAATGLLLALAAPGILGPAPFALLAWVAFVPLLLHVPRVRPVRAALLAWTAGMVLFLVAWSWYPGLLARFSGLPPVAAVSLTLALGAYQSLGWAAWAVIVRVAAPVLPVALVAPAAFVVVERFQPAIFPFSLGITQYRFPLLAQVAELGGPCVLTFLFVLVAAALAGACRARREGRPRPVAVLATAGGLVAAALLFGAVRRAEVREARADAPILRVAALQAGAQRTGWTPPPADPARLGRYQRLTATVERDGGPVDLVVWPEKAYPFPLRRDARHDYRPGHDRRIREGFASALLFGAETIDPQTREVGNSAALLLPDDTLRVVYDKVRLIFWSERLPAWLEGLAGGPRRYRPGARLEPLRLTLPDPGDPDRVRRVVLASFICFEATFPEHVRALVARGATLLVNLSDDSWFGATAEPEQHLAQAVFRAVESRRDLVRATGSGVSAFVTATGEVVRRAEVSHRVVGDGTALVGDVRLLALRGWYADLGDAFAAWCGLVVAAGLGFGLRRRG